MNLKKLKKIAIKSSETANNFWTADVKNNDDRQTDNYKNIQITCCLLLRGKKKKKKGTNPQKEGRKEKN